MPERSNQTSRAANLDDLLAWAEIHQSEDSEDGEDESTATVAAGKADADDGAGGAAGREQSALPGAADEGAETESAGDGPVATPMASSRPPAPGDGDPWLDEEPTRWRLGSKTRRRMLYALGGIGAVAASSGGWILEHRLTASEHSNDSARSNQSPNERFDTPAEAEGFADRSDSMVAPRRGPEQTPDLEGDLVWGSPSEAAGNTEVVVDTLSATDDPVIHLLRRVTFGPTPALVESVQAQGIDGWLDEQLHPEDVPDGVGDVIGENFPLAGASVDLAQAEQDENEWHAMTDTGKATLARAFWSRHQLYEVMVDLWANHLNVPCPSGGDMWDVAASYNQNVIRPHALGRFEDMLIDAVRHPALLRYLSNDKSRKESVNENLGRELLELHTVGIAAGYTEEDVRNSSYILTGRAAPRDGNPNGSSQLYYNAEWHWTGEVRVLDFQHANDSAEGGLDVGDEYVRYLANHPATARTIARKIAIRFVSDDPAPELVDRLADAYLENDTAIVPVLDLLFRSSEFWAAVGEKTRRPMESLAATVRIVGVQPGEETADAFNRLYGLVNRAGHRPLAWPSPDGYPDVHPPWRSVSGNLEVWNSQRRLVRGWNDGLSYREPEDLLPEGAASGTAGEFVDAVCERVCFQTFADGHRQTLLDYLGVDESAPASDLDLDDSEVAAGLISLVLHSPYFALR